LQFFRGASLPRALDAFWSLSKLQFCRCEL
jgi:hypothetical protein